MFKRLPMCQLNKTDLIREFFESNGFRLVVTSPDAPPIILLHIVAFGFYFHDFDDPDDSDLIIKVLRGPAMCSSKMKEPSYLSLLCNHFQKPIHVKFFRSHVSVMALSLEEYNRRAKDDLRLTEEEMKKISEDNLESLEHNETSD